MKPSTLECLLTAIALPLSVAILSFTTPVGAEQIARSRSITAREFNSEDSIPSVTDLNLSVPIDRQDSSSETPIRADSSPNRSATSSNSKRSQSSISTQNAGTTAPSLRVKSSSSRNSTVAAEQTPVSSKKYSSNRRIAAVSPAPFRGNYLRLVKDPSNRTNNLGNPIHTLEVYRNGVIYQRFDATSGTAISQNRDRSVPDIAAPLQDGLYTVSGQIVPGTIPEVGKTFIAVFPRFETARTDLGIHVDPSFNKRNGFDGTAGCIAMTNSADRDAINEFVLKYQPRNLFVKIMPE
jgi:hypothetical protein